MSNFLCHFEILTSDLKKAKSFYGKLFGWQIKPWGTTGTYEMIKTPQDPQGGMEQTDKEKGVLIYIKVDDIEKMIGKVKELGGKVVLEKTQIPNVGYFAIFTDLDGNKIALFNNK